MEAYKTSAVVEEDGTVTISGLPFQQGEELEVILLQQTRQTSRVASYPLRGGKPVKYVEPFESVAEEDWEAPN